MFGGGGNRRYTLEFTIQARNALNNVNLGSPIGNLSSPLFGQSNRLGGGFRGGGATANRRIEVDVHFTF